MLKAECFITWISPCFRVGKLHTFALLSSNRGGLTNVPAFNSLLQCINSMWMLRPYLTWSTSGFVTGELLRQCNRIMHWEFTYIY